MTDWQAWVTDKYLAFRPLERPKQENTLTKKIRPGLTAYYCLILSMRVRGLRSKRSRQKQSLVSGVLGVPDFKATCASVSLDTIGSSCPEVLQQVWQTSKLGIGLGVSAALKNMWPSLLEPVSVSCRRHFGKGWPVLCGEGC